MGNITYSAQNFKIVFQIGIIQEYKQLQVDVALHVGR